jgi:amidase
LWHGFVIEHVISRSVRDSAAALDATAGADPGAPYGAPGQGGGFLEALDQPPGRLRIAFTDRPLLGSGRVHADCSAAVRHAAGLLERLGHHVEEAVPPVDASGSARDFVLVVAAEARALIEKATRWAGAPLRADGFEPVTWALGLLGRATPAPEYIAAVERLQLAGRRLAPFFASWDLLLTPTLAAPPVGLGELEPAAAERGLLALVNATGAGRLLRMPQVLEPMAAKTFEFAPYTALFNATGQPAMSVPLFWNAEGLPVGVQLAGRLGDDALLLRLAAQLETAQPWFARAPQYP